MKLNNQYTDLLKTVLDSPIELNQRTGENIKVIEYPVNITLDLRERIVPTIGVRKTFPKSAAAEIAWFLQGSQDATFITKYAPFWNKFIEDIETPQGLIQGVKASYGYRWRNHFGRDQIEEAIKALREDPTNRRIYINAWDSKEDGLTTKGQSNVPCPVGFNLCIVNGKLNSTITLRSSDLFVGLPYDVMGHAYLMDAIATSIGVNPGFMGVSLNHAHLYEVHWQYTLEALAIKPVVPLMKLPGISVEEIVKNPDLYVENIIAESKLHSWPEFNPKPHVVAEKEKNEDVIEFLNKKNTLPVKKKLNNKLT